MPCTVEGGKLEDRAELGDPEVAGTLQRGQHPRGTIDRLDHPSLLPRTSGHPASICLPGPRG